ncbi:unnamed protein product [Ranitomeya imitator]|uniref:Suppressor of fused-like domain-containing protein n=1 Tax=Ranitomeya imitator TaxID=111125 RepID=A0ABN9MB95_9NEOB|nr:unnamed protein product [Ranitomeya imitator]
MPQPSWIRACYREGGTVTLSDAAAIPTTIQIAAASLFGRWRAVTQTALQRPTMPVARVNIGAVLCTPPVLAVSTAAGKQSGDVTALLSADRRSHPVQEECRAQRWRTDGCRYTGPDGSSGFGFELSFRLKREQEESAPPTWPAELMQGLARYVFQSAFLSGKNREKNGTCEHSLTDGNQGKHGVTKRGPVLSNPMFTLVTGIVGRWRAVCVTALQRPNSDAAAIRIVVENTFCSGDHVSWHSPLDNSESRIQHMLLTEDPQMRPVQTPFGFVSFLQIVGVCTEELHAAQQWNGQGILELLRTLPIAGGPWLITDMRRGETIFEIDPHLQVRCPGRAEERSSRFQGYDSQVDSFSYPGVVPS